MIRTPTSRPLAWRLALVGATLIALTSACKADRSGGRSGGGDIGVDTNPGDVTDTGSDTGDGDTDQRDTGPQDTGPQDTGPRDTGSPDTDNGDCDQTRVGNPCGRGNCGALVCRGTLLVCTGDVVNACGGCGELEVDIGDACELPFGATGEYRCDAETAEPECVNPGSNACGGTVALDAEPGGSCGDCALGEWYCDGVDALICTNDPGVDACGGCSGILEEPGDACGPCDDGILFCSGTDLQCAGASEGNICGGCAPIAETPGEACSDTCGSGTWECAADGESLRCAGGDTANLCGGCGSITQGGVPGAACSQCGEWECLTESTTICSNPRGRNLCGGCRILEGIPGAECGCGGEWECNGTESVTCVGGDAPNECGGCDDLSDERPIGSDCEECGKIGCVGPNEVACIDPGTNVCGSCLEEPIGFGIGGDCGCGGSWYCNGGQPDCDDMEGFLNLCGGCGPISGSPPGTTCGICGEYVCDAGKTTTTCVEQPVNSCGGCQDLGGLKAGDPCGECHVYACAGDGSLVCVPDGANACGTCEPLDAEPGFACGTESGEKMCGTYVCSETGTEVICDDPGVNVCGGCGPINVTLGSPCGPCDGNVWECDPGGFIVCGGVALNDCGGCGPVTGGEVNTPCDDCGRWICDRTDADAKTTVCVPGTVFACGLCTRPERFPELDEGDPCTVCGETGEMVCQDGEALCSTADHFNACGGCSALEGDPGTACGICGVRSCSSANNIICLDPCL